MRVRECVRVHTCGESMPWAVFSRLCRKHVAWSNTPASHGVKSLVLCTSQSSGQSMVNQIYSLSCREQLHNKKMRKKPPVNSKDLCRNFIWFKITTKTTQHDSTILLVNYTDECVYFFWIKKKTDQWFFSNKYVFVCFEEQHCGARAASGPFVKAPPSRWETAHTAPNCWWAYF